MKMVIGDPAAGRPERSRIRGLKAVPRRHVRDEDGGTRTVYVLDVDSATFDDDLLTVFKRNVARARRQHPAVTKKARAAE